MARFKGGHRPIPPRNMMMISVLCHILLFLEYSILLRRSNFKYEVIDISGVDAKFSGCRSDGYLILGGNHKFRVDLLSIYTKFLCWYCWGVFSKYLYLPFQYLYLRYFRGRFRDPSLLRPSWRSHHHRGWGERYTTIGTWVVSEIGSILLYLTLCMQWWY